MTDAESLSTGELYRVALYQKWLIVLIGANVIINVSQRAVAPGADDALSPVAGAVLLLSLATVAATITVFVLMLSAMRMSVPVRIAGAIALVLPIIGLIVLLVYAVRASKLLAGAGVRVGLLGVPYGALQELKARGTGD